MNGMNWSSKGDVGGKITKWLLQKKCVKIRIDSKYTEDRKMIVFIRSCDENTT
jgi:hypothetical protein